jgi:hypothetical protein
MFLTIDYFPADDVVDLLFLVGVPGQRSWFRFLSVKELERGSSRKTLCVPLLPLCRSWILVVLVVYTVTGAAAFGRAGIATSYLSPILV